MVLDRNYRNHFFKLLIKIMSKIIQLKDENKYNINSNQLKICFY